MKNIIMKLLFSFALVPIVFMFLILAHNSPFPFVQNVSATCWGSSCNSDPYYQVCLQTGETFAGPVYSADIQVVVNNTGTAPIPPGQKFKISVYPSTGSTANNACSDVTCLDRSILDYPATWNGPGSIDLTFDTIGCSLTGTCTNDYTVTAGFAEPILDSTLNCPNPPQSVSIINGQKQTVTFDLNCTKPTQETPTPTIAACVKPPKPQPTITCSGCN